MNFVLVYLQTNKQDEVEAEMKKLRQELKQTMELYSNACREALSAKQQVCKSVAFTSYFDL